jgi:hypothetical protein
MTTDLATQEITPEELELLQKQQESEVPDDLFQTPILKIGEALTREVQAGEAEAGEFIDTLRGEGIGNKVEFIASYFQLGRFASDQKSGRAYVAFSTTIPEAWADLVGEEFVGTPFDEYPDAEEVYKQRANAKEIEWGSGPLVSTTFNFTGLVIVPAVEGSDDPDEIRPVRLSLKRTNVPPAKKILTLLRSGGASRQYWDRALELSTEKKTFDRGASHLLVVKQGRPTTPEEKQQATRLAVLTAQGRVTDNQAAAEGPAARVEPEDDGGLAV